MSNLEQKIQTTIAEMLSADTLNKIGADSHDIHICVVRICAEVVALQEENYRLRTLWTEARAVVTQSRNANCLISYGKVQCDAVAAANAWLDKMPNDCPRDIMTTGTELIAADRLQRSNASLRGHITRLKRSR
jgi:hypothetical protein